MFEDCCVECGHLLSRQRDLCPFCGWRLQGDDYPDRLESDDPFDRFAAEHVRADQLTAAHLCQERGYSV